MVQRRQAALKGATSCQHIDWVIALLLTVLHSVLVPLNGVAALRAWQQSVSTTVDQASGEDLLTGVMTGQARIGLPPHPTHKPVLVLSG
jgi:hypothetical protein